MSREIGTGLMVGMVLVVLLVSPVEGADGPGEERILLITSPPYMDVSTLEQALVNAGWDVVTLCLDGSFADGVRRLSQLSPEIEDMDVLVVGAAVLPVRWWLHSLGSNARPDRLLLIAPVGAGSVAADALYAEQLAARVERYRRERGMYRSGEGVLWARPEYVGLEHYVAQRSRNLFEPLYGSYLASQHLSLLPAGFEGAVGFLGWLSVRYPARIPAYLMDEETPITWNGTLSEIEMGDPGRVLSWGYMDLLSALTARRTYLTLVPASQVLSQDLMLDVTLGPSWKTVAVEFARRRAVRFLNDYIIPNLANRGRQEAVLWLEQQLSLEDDVLLYQLPQQVAVPGPEGSLEVPANQLIRGIHPLEDPGAKIIVATAPNWWQIFDPYIGPNDWWTETQSAMTGATGDVIELFMAVGGRVGQDEKVAATAVELLGGGVHGPAPNAVMEILGRFADGILNLATRLRYPRLSGVAQEDLEGARGDEQAEVRPGDVAEEVPEIRATYRNKSTTLKTEQRVQHATWAWDFGDGEVHLDGDPANLAGDMEHTYRETGEYEVRAQSLAADGTVLDEGQWNTSVSSGQWTEVFPYEAPAELVPEIRLRGPESWVVGRPARYWVDVHLDEVPGQVENLRIVFYPGEEFDVVWERPGTFQVRGAVNLRYSWRRSDGSSRFFSVTFTEERPVQVLATTLTGH